MTKLATAVACIQLLEQGKLSLDDPELINKQLPELVKQPILTGFDADGKPQYKPRTKPITLRHLLTHTSGLGYAFLNPDIGRWEAATSAPNWTTPGVGLEAIEQPLTFEPGEQFQYSIGIDWAGILVERLTGDTLHNYMVNNIFQPIGANTITFYPNDALKKDLQSMAVLDPSSGKIVAAPGLRDVPNLTQDDVRLHVGGAGLLGTLRDYLAFITELLRCQTRDGIIKKSSWDLVFKSQLPPTDGSKNPFAAGQGAAHQFLGVDMADWCDGSGVSWSLGLNVNANDSPHGRKAGSGQWEGIAKTKYWIDPTTGIAAVCGTQLIDMDPGVFMSEVYPAFEEIVYANLKQ